MNKLKNRILKLKKEKSMIEKYMMRTKEPLVVENAPSLVIKRKNKYTN